MKKLINFQQIYLIGISAGLFTCNSHSPYPKPNVIVILADDMGWGDLNCNGNEFISTPVLNRLKNESLSFERFYVCPLSAPSRAEFLTGRYFLKTGVSSVTQGFENMRNNEVTIAEILKENGYSTGCFGKWHNGGYYLQHPNRQGFDEFTGFCMGHLGYYFDATFLHNDDKVQSNGYSSDFFTDRAIEFIDSNKENPFFCYLAFNVPHSPFQVPEKYFKKYNSQGLDSTLSAVYGMVENMDSNIGRVLRKIEDLNLKERTLVIFFSDNGPNTARFNGGMKGLKGSVDEGGIKVPFFISWPSSVKPGITGQLSQDIDILPTLLHLCRIKYDPVMPLDGQDLSGIITGSDKQFDRFIFSRQGNQELRRCNGSVRNDRYRLVRTGKDTLLYDLENDPSQIHDIKNSERKTAEALIKVLSEWEYDLVTNYVPVTTIEAGFEDEKSFTLPVQDAVLSGMVRFSSIYPNQSYTENWKKAGDSVFWDLNIINPGTYKADIRYGCPESDIGSIFSLSSETGKISFKLDHPFESEILPDRDYVKRSESVERTWSWITVGNLPFHSGRQTIVLKLENPVKLNAGIIREIRFTKL